MQKLAEWDEPGEDEAESDRLHDWLPFAIVAVSLGAAVMGWQGSVADERATHKDEVSRQDLVRLAQLKLNNVQTVDADIRVFGEVEQHNLQARELRRDARRVSGPQRLRLAAEAGRERAVARSLAQNLLRYSNVGPQLSPDRRALAGRPYDVRSALALAESGNEEMASLEPNPLRAAAKRERAKGLHLTGLAVLFIVGLVFFTLAAVNRGGRAQMFASLGATAAVAALILFPIVRF